MSSRRYTKDHEWVAVEGSTATIGISDYAQQQLGDVVFVELPAIGATVTQSQQLAVVESVKAASEVYAPVSGTVSAINTALESDPAKVNADPHGEGWFAKVTLSTAAELETLMDESAYASYLKEIA